MTPNLSRQTFYQLQQHIMRNSKPDDTGKHVCSVLGTEITLELKLSRAAEPSVVTVFSGDGWSIEIDVGSEVSKGSVNFVPNVTITNEDAFASAYLMLQCVFG